MAAWNFQSTLVPVSGAGSGIGLAVCRRLRQEGGTPLLLDRDAARLAAAVAEIYPQASDASRHGYQVDVSDSAAVDACFDRIRAEHGLVTHAVANAGIVGREHLLDITDAQWHRVLSVNLDGVLFFCRAAGRHLAERRGGAIVNLASIAGLASKASRPAYSASKGAVVNLTRSIAMDLGEFGVRANAVAPGVIDTPIQAGNPQGLVLGIAGRSPLKRMGAPEEIANVVLFLLSDLASYMTGQTVVVDGGVTATYA